MSIAPAPASASASAGVSLPRPMGSFRATRLGLYVLLTLTVLATAGSLGAVIFASQAQQSDGPVINRAGRQRMLSQKISKESLLLLVADQQQRPVLLKRLMTSYTDWVRAHKGLLDGDAELLLPGTPSGPLRDKMMVADRFFQEMRPLVEAAAVPVATDDERKLAIRGFTAAERSDANGLPVSLNEQFLKAMDEATFAFDSAAKDRSSLLRAIAIAGGTLVVILTAIAVIFSRRLGTSLIAAEAATINLQALTADLQALNLDLQKGIVELQRAVREAASGDLRVRARIASGPLAEIASGFNGMLEALATLVRQVQAQVVNTEQAVARLGEISGRVADGADRQAERLMSAQAALEAVSNGLAQAAAVAVEASTAAHRTRESADGGSELVQQAVSGMDAVRIQVQAGARQMKALGDRSMEITGIISAIGRITEQTNMLALNAAIEAARAGEQGRGFGVVADEVGKLADRATEASQEIGQLVTAIQTETHESVERFEQQTREVEDETVTVGRAGHALGEIRNLSMQSADLAGRITAIASGQVEAARGVVNTVQGLNTISLQTLRDADAARDLSVSLSVSSGELRNSISRFTVG